MSALSPTGAADEGFLAAAGVFKRFEPRVSLGARLGALLGAKVERRAVRAVDDVSFALRRGEVLGLVGESGCGKSTLGRVLAGIHAPSAGEATLGGAPVMAGSPPRKSTTRVQMVFQDPFASLDPRMRVGDTIAEGPLAHRLTTRGEAAAYVARWLEAVGLPGEAASRFPHQFSGGQRQRVALARALAMQPDALVCDEPVASLDVSIQAQILNLFLRLKRELSLTMVFISHDLSVVRHVSDRVAVMYLGRIVEIGETSAVFDAPAHPYTRALLDSVPTLSTDGSPGTVAPIAGELPSPLAPPSGCHFHGRCPRVFAPCPGVVPPLDAVPLAARLAGPAGPLAHRAACHLHDPRFAGEARPAAAAPEAAS